MPGILKKIWPFLVAVTVLAAVAAGVYYICRNYKKLFDVVVN